MNYKKSARSKRKCETEREREREKFNHIHKEGEGKRHSLVHHPVTHNNAAVIRPGGKQRVVLVVGHAPQSLLMVPVYRQKHYDRRYMSGRSAISKAFPLDPPLQTLQS